MSDHESDHKPDKHGKPDHYITFYVDAEELTTDQKAMSVRAILNLAGDTPPENFYLLEYRGQHEQARHDSMDEVIKLHNNLRFAAVYRGETPVS